MERIWQKRYADAVANNISSCIYNNLDDFFEGACSKFSANIAFTNYGVELSYNDLKVKVKELAKYFQQELKLQPGDRLAIMMPNLLQYPVTLFAAIKAGLVVVNINPLYTKRELGAQLRDSGAKAIVILENFAHVLEGAFIDHKPEHVILTNIGDQLGFKGTLMNLAIRYIKKMIPKHSLGQSIKFNNALAIGAKIKSLDKVEIKSSDLAFLQYTGGTTGKSKGAMLTHSNIVSNVYQILELFNGWDPPLFSRKEVILTPLPLYHIFSLSCNCMTYMALGGNNILITNPKDLKSFIKLMQKTKFTCMTGVNTLFNGLLNQSGFEHVDFSEVKYVISGGMALQGSVADRWKKQTGLSILEGYGLTETSPIVTANPKRSEFFTASVGVPLPSTDIKVVDANEQELDIEEEGELLVKGPQVMKGYWQNTDETNKVLEQGWFKTGDIARVDANGMVYIVDRKKDMIIVSGFNVYPNEVESVISMLPEVAEVAVVGESDEKTGEVVKACVKLNTVISSADIIQHCRNNLTGYKVPKKVVFYKELPKSNVGKVLRRELREEPN